MRWTKDYEKLDRPIEYWVAKDVMAKDLIQTEEGNKNRGSVVKNMKLLSKVFEDKQKDHKLASSGKDAELARAEAELAKGMFSESGSTSLPGLLGTITNLANKMYRLVKLKRVEWKTSVPSKDLREVHGKVMEYLSKMKEIDPNDKVMGGYKNMHKLSIERMGKLGEEFNVLVQTSNYNNSVNVPLVSGGKRRIRKSRTVFKGEGQPIKVMSFFRKN